MKTLAAEASPIASGASRSFPSFLLVWLAGLAVIAATALAFQQPGYLDAYAYQHVAANAARGRGWVETFVWPYLQAPDAVVHPAHLYWMPLTSAVMVPFLWLSDTHLSAQLPFILLASLLPVVSYGLGRSWFGEQRLALGMAALTLFAGFYFAFWSALDSFALFALAVTAALWACGRLIADPRPRWAVLAGLGTALAHLARIDGLFVLLVLVVTLLGIGRRIRWRRAAGLLAAGGAAYLAVAGPWLLRNWLVTGTPLPGGGTKVLWLREYNEFFSYQRELTPAYFFGGGFSTVVGTKLEALGTNLLTVLGYQVWLLPFVALGLILLWRRPALRPGLGYCVGLWLALSLVFTLPSTHGTMLHSGAAMLPWLAACAVFGLERGAAWLGKYRRAWAQPAGQRVLLGAFLLAAVLASGFQYAANVKAWDNKLDRYRALVGWFRDNAPPDSRPIVVDPPAFAYAGGGSSLVTPDDGIEAAVAIARRYGARYLTLESAHPQAFHDLYEGRASDPRLVLVGEQDRFKLWAIRIEQ